MDANSPEILETLHTLIAPGNQIRLSPYIEAMQFQLLFGRSPDPSKRFETAKAILDANRKRVQALAATWIEFDQAGKNFRPELYDNDFLDAYLAYYLTVNVGKLQILFLDLLRQDLLPPRFHLLDVGVASGTTVVALMDFLTAWESACLLHDTVFPVEAVELIGVDACRDCLDYSRKAVEVLARVIDDSGVSEQPFAAWANAAHWVERNVALEPLDLPEAPTLLVCSNILSEDGMAGHGHLYVAQAIRHLTEQSLVLLLEPGDKRRARDLNGWRTRLLDDDPTLHLVGPCGSEHGAPAPTQCSSCWNARRESLHRPLLYQRFCEEAAKLGDRENPKWQQEYENNLLSWSYLCLARNSHPSASLDLSPLREGISTRFIGRYRGNQSNSYRPATYDEEILVSDEKIKFCPAACNASYKALTLHRERGFVLPPMDFGQAVRLEGIVQQDSKYPSEFLVRAESIVPLTSDSPTRFLSGYSDSARKGIDAIAHRLFGFPAMREFQHRILKRVLAGRSIFAIAATGGGKSECYILPAMLLPGLTVVISPLKSLMQDQYDQRLCARYGLGSISTFINSSIPFRERENRIRRMELGYYKLVYLTPEQCAQGRMLDSLRRANEWVGLRYLALDEAHCISHWGHDFRPAYLNLLTRIKDQGLNPVRIALTATASPQVRKDICDELSLNPDPIEQGGDLLVYSANRPELNLIVRVTDTVAEKVRDIEDRLHHLLRENRNDSGPGAAIVFMPYTGPAETKATGYNGQELDFSGRRTVAHFASHLERVLSTRVGIYHGKMEDDSDDLSHAAPQPDAQGSAASPSGALGKIRDRNRRDEQERFIRGDTDIMVATKGFGMGIDKPNIRLVVHHTTPGNLEAYTQEAGRAGRDGALADVVLYFTPQAPDDSGGRATADGEVQRFFLDQKYIREDDVRGLWDFLCNRARQPGAFHRPGKLYFTADEVMGCFDTLAGAGRYQWPDFPKRETRGRESPGHAAILDHGHLYQEKSNLIERILSVCYRIRPVANGRQLILLHEVASVGTSLKRGRIFSASAILASNDRFAQSLLEKGLDAGKLCNYLDGDKDLFPLATRLDLSLQDTASLLQDIKKADGEWRGQPGRRTWQSNLLNFLIIAAPKRGPAEGKDSLWAWRSYAGATRRATKSVADKRARRGGRSRATEDDDWFYWGELPYARGWEVTLGEVLDEPGLFDAYLEAFLSMHDRRRDEDNRAYQLLLRDYIGVTEDGRRLGQNGGCLRVVMLGYLKTNETVVDGNCGGCSICCPDEQFETDLTRRKGRIVRLSDALSQILGEFEQRVSESPPVDRLDLFWKQVATDEQAGHAVIGYLRGWTNRLISETPGHVTAYWLRVDGMLRERLPVVEGDLLHDLDRLRELAPGESDLLRLADMLAHASAYVDAHPARFDLTKARLMHRLGRAEDELDAWMSLIGQAPGVELALEANRSLAVLFAPGAAFADPQAQRKALAAALDVAPDRARNTIEPFLPDWAFAELMALLEDVEPALVNQLATDWFALHDREEPQVLLDEALSTLNRDGYSQTSAAVSRTVQPLLLDLLDKLPEGADGLDALMCRIEPYITCHMPRWLGFAAERFDHLGHTAVAKEYWEFLMALPAGEGSEERSPAMTVDSAWNLARLYAKDGPCPDAQRHREAMLKTLDEAPERAAEIVEPYAAEWNLGELCDILTCVPDESHVAILVAWFRTAKIEIGRLVTKISTLLKEHAGLRKHPRIASQLVCQMFVSLDKYRDAMLARESCVDLAAIRELATTWLDVDCHEKKARSPGELDSMLWQLLQSADHADATVIGRIREPNKGGFTVDLGGVQAFLPKSLSSHLRFSESSTEQTLEFKIVEFPHRRGRDLVLSRRKLAEQRFAALSIGQRVEGLVSGIVEYGAFVDLGGFDSLLHKSEMGKGYGAVPSEILAEGQRITVVVVGIDRDRRRVSLRLSRDGEK